MTGTAGSTEAPRNREIFGGKLPALVYAAAEISAMSSPLNSPKDADWYACPSCGAEVQVGSRGCPKCSPGAGRSWQRDPHPDGVDLPDDPEEFDYNDFVRREFGRGPAKAKPAGLAWKWWITGVLLLILMAWGLVRQVW